MQETLVNSLYSSVLWIRMVEETIAAEYPKYEMRTPTHLHIGQEAVPAAVCQNLLKDDYVYGYYRSHGWYLAKGGNLDKMMAELFGKATGCSDGRGGSMHLIDLDVGFTGTSAIVAGAMPHAVGGAFAFKSRKTNQVAVSCFGDGATEEGLFQEVLMFSVLRKLPVVFICENNGLATNTWIQDRQPNVQIFERARGHGIHSEQVDGNDALAVYEAARKAVQRARDGEGPSFIECMTYRYLEHCGPLSDVHLGHRTDEQIAEWKKRDPLPALEKKVDPKFAADLKAQYTKKIQAAFDFARRSPFPTQLIYEEELQAASPGASNV